MKCRLLFDMVAGPSAPDDICVVEDGKRFLKAETILDHPDAYKLVHGGHAESVDDECREKVKTMSQTTRGLMREIHARITNEFDEFQASLQEESEESADMFEEETDEETDEENEEPASES
jgi:hypothetical protein